jgi:UDP-glucose 4-epimerase
MNKIQGKRILVTGAAGFIGRHLCQRLHDNGACVFGLVRSYRAEKELLFKQYVIDISDHKQVNQLLQDVQPEMIVHLAAVKNRSDELDAFRRGFNADVLGTINLIEASMALQSLISFVFIGSCDEYGQQEMPFVESVREKPNSAYGVTKLAVTQVLQTLARSKSFPAVILRPSVIYGPGQGADMFIPSLIHKLISHQKFAMTKGEQTRDFLYINDMVEAILLALVTAGINGEIINISSSSPIRIDYMARKIAQLIGVNAEKLLDFGAMDYRSGETMNYWANNSHAKALLGWAPLVSLEDGLCETVNYYNSII